MLRILANQSPKDPEPDWKLSDETKQTGLEGITHTRAVLEAKRKQLAGEALSPSEVQVLTDLHNQEHQQQNIKKDPFGSFLIDTIIEYNL